MGRDPRVIDLSGILLKRILESQRKIRQMARQLLIFPPLEKGGEGGFDKKNALRICTVFFLINKSIYN
jgi:hypothetical protein